VAGEPRRPYDNGDYSVSDLANVFSASRQRTIAPLQRAGDAAKRSRCDTLVNLNHNRSVGQTAPKNPVANSA
jgi:hypothetical protein